jgi:predicted enzyme related to lactoylglutathione lyase
MGERTRHEPGTFSWADLSTTDQDDAKRFYGELFGWAFEDAPAGEGVVYSMARIDGRDVGAISPQPQQQREAGVPPLWNSYITVSSADTAGERIAAAGGSVHAGPFDVFDAGRMAVAQDPQGAFFMVWEPRRQVGAGLVNAPGALCWNELATTDLDAARGFYRDVFGWDIGAPEGDMEYAMVMNGDRQNGGARTTQPGEPPHWLVYFGTDDVDATMAKTRELGGDVVAGRIDMGDTGSVAVLRDPQGAVFAVFAGGFDD